MDAKPGGDFPNWVATDWRLFTDWCRAVGEEPLPTGFEALARFTRDCQGAATTVQRRLRAIAFVHEMHSCPITGADAETAVPSVATFGRDDDHLGLREAISACPSLGWPAGLRGRRDAFLLVLLGDLGLGKGDARRLQTADVDLDPVSVVGRAITTAGRGVDDAVGCPACAVVAWLEALDALGLGGRVEATSLLTRPATVSDRHRCRQPDLAGRWTHAASLLPPIDQYGWLEEDRSLTTRAMLSIVTHRRDVARLEDSAPFTPAAGPNRELLYPESSVDDLMRRAEELADEIIARTTEIFARDQHGYGAYRVD